MIKGRSCKNPPYDHMTDKKWSSLGETITVKQALDMWWNSVRVRILKKDTPCIYATIYKCDDGEYVIDKLASTLKLSQKKVLQLKITLDDEYDEDGDYNPIVYAKLILEQGGK